MSSSDIFASQEKTVPEHDMAQAQNDAPVSTISDGKIQLALSQNGASATPAVLAAPLHSTGSRLMFILKTRGPHTIAALAKMTQTTTENIRQQLQKACIDGYVEFAHAPKQVKAGRPTQLWQLTDKGNALFPDSHADLTVTLLRHMASLGEGITERVIQLREQEILTNYQAAISTTDKLGQRIARLAELRSAEGYMSEFYQENDGTWMLIENHCPICAAATHCQGFCRSELAIFQSILGDACLIERCEHILLGARRCAYRITALPAL